MIHGQIIDLWSGGSSVLDSRAQEKLDSIGYSKGTTPRRTSARAHTIVTMHVLMTR